MESTETKIKKSIIQKERGELLFPDDFRKLGSSEAVRLALHRIEKEGFIRRVAQGLYVRPKLNKYVGEVLPTAEKIAQSIAKRDKIRLVPTGVYALSALGLSTQVPMKLVFLTDGAPREIKLGKRSIKLKKTTPKNLSAIGNISRLVIQALREIGKEQLTNEEEAKIINLLKKENKKELLHDLELAPVWIQKIMEKALNKK
ncbi:hypothetical protein DET49_10348 [Salegentibacter sp. 24]|jgi:ribosomal protein S19E (S16A)|uniref:DUF6088 family protein n=1 Tax=Salegentibacter sp. 24 TaxID=2183986 RepID=UPI00105FC8B1|nr:DUF6088 family protein [Salegentibacter sp. 24]TDN94982.1 hypothetical protein DET49_10348 [Salegentibacter sp. 24]